MKKNILTTKSANFFRKSIIVSGLSLALCTGMITGCGKSSNNDTKAENEVKTENGSKSDDKVEIDDEASSLEEKEKKDKDKETAKTFLDAFNAAICENDPYNSALSGSYIMVSGSTLETDCKSDDIVNAINDEIDFLGIDNIVPQSDAYKDYSYIVTWNADEEKGELGNVTCGVTKTTGKIEVAYDDM